MAVVAFCGAPVLTTARAAALGFKGIPIGFAGTGPAVIGGRWFVAKRALNLAVKRSDGIHFVDAGSNELIKYLGALRVT